MIENRFEMLTNTSYLDACMPYTELDCQAAALETLSAAADLARAGDCQRARELCAAVVFEIQPLIAASKELMCITLHALLLARGFKLLSRLVMAVSGLEIEVKLMPDHNGCGAPLRRAETAGRTVYFLDPNWPARLSPNDAFLRSWIDDLAGWRSDRHLAAEPVRHLEMA
jgi:hypothetical protein